MEKLKIVIQQRRLPHYRIPLFNELSEIFGDVTVIYSQSDDLGIPRLFNSTKVGFTKKWKFYYQFIDFYNLKKFDYIILEFDLSYLSNFFILLFFRKKVILWGQAINNNKFNNFVRAIWANFAKSIIVYMPSKKSKLRAFLLNKNKIFVARNSVVISNPTPPKYINKRDTFLFIGTLYSDKKIPDLIVAFSKIVKFIPEEITVTIIGDGPDKENCKNLVKERMLDNRIIFLDKIVNEEELDLYYNKAIASVSPDSSGLTIINSFSKSVPFVTRRNARSGGEIDNIIDEYNGLLYNGEIEVLCQILLKLISDLDFRIKLSENAFNHYVNNCKIEFMTKGFVDSINYMQNGEN